MDPRSELHAAARLLAEGDARAAAERLRALLASGGLSPGFEADARYFLGRALGACGDRDGKLREWSQRAGTRRRRRSGRGGS